MAAAAAAACVRGIGKMRSDVFTPLSHTAGRLGPALASDLFRMAGWLPRKRDLMRRWWSSSAVAIRTQPIGRHEQKDRLHIAHSLQRYNERLARRHAACDGSA